MKTREKGLRTTAVLAIAGILGGAVAPTGGMARQAAAQEPAYAPDESPVQSAAPTPVELQQLVAPIALYPDELVAQILAAATYPEQVVEADRWMEAHRGLQGQALAAEVDRESWDPSVKALTAFPSVLANMDKNLAWTSSLGDAYVNHEPEVMGAVQDMRQRAQAAGNLKTTPQTTVTQEGQTIVIQPANPQVVYVPQYDPWVVYGAPVAPWPGWFWYPGLFVAGPGIVFGVGFPVAFFGGFGWGFPFWGCDWHRHAVVFHRNVFVTRGPTFVNRNVFNRGRLGFARPAPFRGNELGGRRGPLPGPGHVMGGPSDRRFEGGRAAAPAVHVFRGPEHEAPGGPVAGSRWGAFSGFDHGGVTRGESFRGQSSLGGGVVHHRAGGMRRG
jgi:hypothetical protein